MISAVNAFKAKIIFVREKSREKKMQHFLSVTAVFNDNSSASAASDEAVKKYSRTSS